jgi:hypothetical protein
MNKIIFLDIDGVLNSTKWFSEKKKLPPDSSRYDFMLEMLDPKAITIFKRILKETGATVVLSSSWRGDEENESLLKEHVCDIIDITPRCCTGIRGVEIYKWIQDHIKWDEKNKLNYVILDDDSDMLLWQKDNFFNVDGRIGLTEKIAEGVIVHLNKPVDN